MLSLDRWSGLEWLGTGLIPKPLPDQSVVEEPARQIPVLKRAIDVLRRGRSIHAALGTDGRVHLRRRARQIRRDYGQGVTLQAPPREDFEHVPIRRSPRRWWEGL